MVHAKTATIDGQWSTIGTANIDRLSLLGNYEINIEVFNADVARQMEEIFAIDSSNTVELTLPEWRRRHCDGQVLRDGADAAAAAALSRGQRWAGSGLLEAMTALRRRRRLASAAAACAAAARLRAAGPLGGDVEADAR